MSTTVSEVPHDEVKTSIDHHENTEFRKRPVVDIDQALHAKHHDAALDVLGGERVQMTDEQSRLVCRKIDRRILPILVWIYFLQILDKSVVGYGAVFGLRKEANLVGREYSLIGSAGYWAQLGAQPFIAYLIVRVKNRVLMTGTVFCWGAFMCGLAGSTNFNTLIANRFFLGLFEAACLPLFTVVTMTWYRRREQPMRVAIWYGTNGVASILGSLLAWACSFSKGKLYVYQVLFLIVGLVTVVSAPVIWFFLDDSPAVARFLTPEERKWAVERLRDNNQGVENKEFKWDQVWETLYMPQTWLYIALTFCINTGASVTNVFGPLIISGFGFNPRQTILLNMPFGFLQTAVILSFAYAAMKLSKKSVMIFALLVPCIVGSVLLYVLDRRPKNQGPSLFGYYLLAFLFAGNPLIVSWLASNMAGHTKKALSIALYNAGSSVGNIVGPLLFKAEDAPRYRSGVVAVLGIFVAAAGICAGLVVLFMILNKRKERIRVANGKPAKLVDRSMDAKYSAQVELQEGEEGYGGVRLGDQAFMDMTDHKNDEFIYTF